MMLGLQQQGCHNISIVSGAHYLPDIDDALALAARQGLSVPLVFNSNGYESLRTLRLLSGLVDIYLPDAKYCSDTLAERFSSAPNYHRINIAALREMARQAGGLETDEHGTAVRGLIIRHLVLPGFLGDTRRVLRAIIKNLGAFVTVSLMGQYTPCFEAVGDPALGRSLNADEYRQACAMLAELGFDNGWLQECGPDDRSFIPDFRCEDSWN
jgi:putative pyruvate formate lyase activating enzyme